MVVGLLFLLAMWFSPLAGVIPAQATAFALIIVGFYSIAAEVPWNDYEDAIPAFVTMLVMPFTWSRLLYVVAAAFALYFVSPVIEGALAR